MPSTNNYIMFRDWQQKLSAKRNNSKHNVVIPSSIRQVVSDNKEWANLKEELKQQGIVTNAAVKEYLAMKELSRSTEIRKPIEKKVKNHNNDAYRNAWSKVIRNINHVCRPHTTKERQLESCLFDKYETFLSQTSKDVANAKTDAILLQRSSSTMLIALERVP